MGPSRQDLIHARKPMGDHFELKERKDCLTIRTASTGHAALEGRWLPSLKEKKQTLLDTLGLDSQ